VTASRRGSKIEYVETAQQLGDVLTNPMGRLRFQELRSKVGVEVIKKEQKKGKDC
jgi:hypothetical protein